MTYYTIETLIIVEATEDDDPEDIASSMSQGLEAAVANFPAADVIGAEVTGIRPSTQAEIDQYTE